MKGLLLFALFLASCLGADNYAIRHPYKDAACTVSLGFDELYYWGECWDADSLHVSIKWKGANDVGVTQCGYNDHGCFGDETCSVIPYGACVPSHTTPNTPGYAKWTKVDDVSNSYTRISYGLGDIIPTCENPPRPLVDGKLSSTYNGFGNYPTREYYTITDTSGASSPSYLTCVLQNNCTKTSTLLCRYPIYSSNPTGTNTVVYCSGNAATCVEKTPPTKECVQMRVELDNGSSCQSELHPGYTIPGAKTRYSRVRPNPAVKSSESDEVAFSVALVLIALACLLTV